MRIVLLGTGVLATALGDAWSRAGHTVLVAGRSREKAEALALHLGDGARAIDLSEAGEHAEAVVTAVPWEALDEVMTAVGGLRGDLEGVAVIDTTNPVDFATGALKPKTGSAAEFVADRARGAHVVKALHLFAGQSWLAADRVAVQTVAMCGDDPDALDRASALVRDLGGVPAIVGGLSRARQLEEAAGFVVGLVAGGFDPSTAVPAVPARTR
jgi:predicted dinucleotide-binding enzyme